MGPASLIPSLVGQMPPLPSARATNGFLALCTTYALFALYLAWALLPAVPWLPDP